MLWPVIANAQSNAVPAAAPRPGTRPEHTPTAAPARMDAGDGATETARRPRLTSASPSASAGSSAPTCRERWSTPGTSTSSTRRIIAGAGGVAANAETLSEAEIEAEAEAEGDLTEDELQEGAGGGRGTSNGVSPEQASGAPIRKGNRAIGFLRASWAELQRVQWPDRRHVFQATAVVIGFVAIAGAYLGLADYVAKEIVDFIL